MTKMNLAIEMVGNHHCKAENENNPSFFMQNMYAQLLPLALPAPPGMGGGYGGPSTMPGMGMPPMQPYGMPSMVTY